MVTRRPRDLRSRPRLEAVRPLPRLEATPPVTKRCLVLAADAKMMLPWVDVLRQARYRKNGRAAVRFSAFGSSPSTSDSTGHQDNTPGDNRRARTGSDRLRWENRRHVP